MSVPLGVVQAGMAAATQAAANANERAQQTPPWHCYFCAQGAIGSAAGCGICACTRLTIETGQCVWAGCPALPDTLCAPFGQSTRMHYGFPTFQTATDFAQLVV